MAGMKYRVIAAVFVGAISIAATFGIVALDGKQTCDNTVADSWANEHYANVPLQAAKTKLAVAKRVCQIFHDEYSGARRGGAGTEDNYLWSNRQMSAEVELISLDPPFGLERDAIQRHLDWMPA